MLNQNFGGDFAEDDEDNATYGSQIAESEIPIDIPDSHSDISYQRRAREAKVLRLLGLETRGRPTNASEEVIREAITAVMNWKG